MAFVQNDDLEYIVNDGYYDDFIEFEEDNYVFVDNRLRRSYVFVEHVPDFLQSLHDSDSDSDLDERLDSRRSDTSASEARNGKDIQGIPRERLNFTRDEYRKARLKQYKNYESLALPRHDLHKRNVLKLEEYEKGELMQMGVPLQIVEEGLRKSAHFRISVTFVDKNGEENHIKVPIGMSMLEAAHENDIELELEGACEASLACSTCHVIVMDMDYYNKLEAPTDEENDMLDLAFGLSETSRLGCQVIASPKLDGVRLAIPAVARNFAVDGYVPKPH